ncbi:arylamine N-acetyltransferase family protein [Plantactinospora sp. KLBMP9567]|uniref:arylamine N-acetyltransferase family protein n=1 Tax=Plantactinospora sp. KLBMP9567 TaxID=3085900 RepID=UPI0029816A4E|nr:arylamine N-acetyltransferase [Plantactinospora sp. KLBMP9567]MDW5326421.1 arylamine N-acetyltransferase [Plantactinospora sp. KLBMP9567]
MTSTASLGADVWRPPALDDEVVTAYLRRLGLDPVAERAERPSVAQLHRLHAGHVARVPYETVWIALGETRGMDPVAAAKHLAAGRGGYCYQLNGAFSALLTTLGYPVTWHRAGVQGQPGDPPGDTGNHLALTTVLDGQGWWLDTGLGDGPLDPVLLVAGAFGPDDRFRLRPSEAVPGGWRFDHEPGGALVGMDFPTTTTRPADLLDKHVELSTSPTSGMVRVVTVQHRTPAGVRIIRGRVLSERPLAGSATVRQLSGYAEWRAVLREVFHLPLDDVPDERLRAVWQRIEADHAAWERDGHS